MDVLKECPEHSVAAMGSVLSHASIRSSIASTVGWIV
jgi:hypothetical protein